MIHILAARQQRTDGVNGGKEREGERVGSHSTEDHSGVASVDRAQASKSNNGAKQKWYVRLVYSLDVWGRQLSG